MNFDNVIQGNGNKLQLFSAMRKMLLSKESSPLSPSLFFDQVFNIENLSELEKSKVLKASEVWESSADQHIVFIDSGISNETYKYLLKLESEKKEISYQSLFKYFNSEVLELLNSVSSVDGAMESFNEHLPNHTIESEIQIILKNDSLKYPNHLPTHFHTYFQKSENNDTVISKDPIRCVIESPFAGDISSNVAYAADVIKKLVLSENYSPMASHLLYTRMLDDDNQDERMIGIDAGLNYGLHAEETIICVDRGLSTGMKYGIINSEKNGRKYSFFTLSDDPQTKNEVNNLKTLSDLESWSEKQISENNNLYLKTGYLTKVDSVKIDSEKTEAKQKVII